MLSKIVISVFCVHLALAALSQSSSMLMMAAGQYGEARVIVPAPEDLRHQHLSWPKVVKAEDGSLVVAYIAGRKHVNGDGCPAVSISRDGGRTFSPPQILMNFDSTLPYQHCANLAMGVAEDGAIVLMGMAFTDNLRNHIYGWRSVDNGRSWKCTDTSSLGPNRTGSVFGHVFPVPGKGLAVCGHYRQPKGDGIWMAFSEDNGLSWNPDQRISSEKYYEPVFIYSGQMLIGLVRENSAHAYHQYVSSDLGINWQFRRNVIQGSPDAIHPSPFIIADPVHPERLYSLQTERTSQKEIYLWQAQRDQLEWKRLGLVAACPEAQDFGYPWMTHLSGNEWFLVYYAGEKDGPNSIYGMAISIP